MAKVRINSVCAGGGHLSVTILLDDGSEHPQMLSMDEIENEPIETKVSRVLANFRLACRLDKVTKDTILSKSEKTVFKE